MGWCEDIERRVTQWQRLATRVCWDRRKPKAFAESWTIEKTDWRKGSGQLSFILQMATLNFENMEVSSNTDRETLEKWRSHWPHMELQRRWWWDGSCLPGADSSVEHDFLLCLYIWKVFSEDSIPSCHTAQNAWHVSLDSTQALIFSLFYFASMAGPS